MQLADLFDASLAGRASSVGLEYDGPGGPETLTFGALDARANRLARELAARGVAAGDRLALFVPNGLGFIDAWLASMKLGAVVVPINVLYREREVAHIVGDAAPAAVITTDDRAALLPEGAAGWTIDALTAAAASRPAGPVRHAIDGDAPAAIVYTSGTTGRAKGAVLSHHNVLANAANLVTCWSITADDRYLAVLPLFHVHGLMNGLCTWLAAGSRMRLVERFDPAGTAALFESFAPTLFFGVPTIYVRLLELPADTLGAIGRPMRLFVSGSAPLPAHVLDAFRDRTGHTILERYGMSETLMNLSNPYAGERRAGSVGFPLPGISVRIVAAGGQDAATGEVGELWVRGPNVCAGYWQQPAETRARFVDGWFRTGDLAERSEDGYYTLRGRQSDLIISGGFNIYPREIEEVLLEAPGIREAVVVGVPDATRGELPVAYVVSDTAGDCDALEARCRGALASFKRPRAFVRVDALPRTALGKIQKALLPPWSAPS